LAEFQDELSASATFTWYPITIQPEINPEVAEMYKSNRELFAQTAKYWTGP